MEPGNITPIDLQRYLRGIVYPATKQNLVSHAEENGADKGILEFMERLPDREYKSPADLSQAAGNEMEED